MNGPDFSNPIRDINVAGVKAGSGGQSIETRNAERQKKLVELKQRIATGQYPVDSQALAKRILESGVIEHA